MILSHNLSIHLVDDKQESFSMQLVDILTIPFVYIGVSSLHNVNNLFVFHLIHSSEYR